MTPDQNTSKTDQKRSDKLKTKTRTERATETKNETHTRKQKHKNMEHGRTHVQEHMSPRRATSTWHVGNTNRDRHHQIMSARPLELCSQTQSFPATEHALYFGGNLSCRSWFDAQSRQRSPLARLPGATRNLATHLRLWFSADMKREMLAAAASSSGAFGYMVVTVRTHSYTTA